MKVTINGTRFVDGIPWGVAVEVDLKRGTRAERAIELDGIIQSMTRSGFQSGIVVLDAPQPIPNPQATQSPTIDEALAEMKAQTARSPLEPHCKVHGVAMKPSKVQKKEGVISYYCTKRMGQDGYCRQRATVDLPTGQPSFWEVDQ